MTSETFAKIQPTNTGGSTTSHFSSRNPYRNSGDEVASKNIFHTPQQSPALSSFSNTAQSQALSSHPPDLLRMSDQDNTHCSTPPLPARPAEQSQSSPALPPRPSGQDSGSEAHETHPGFSSPIPPGGYDEDEFIPPPENENFARRDSSMDHFGLPPRRRLTTGDIPINSVGYARNPERLVAYLIPLPAPVRQGQKMDVPQRYMLYTPPAPHLLKPEDPKVKEGKRHKLKRLAQQEIKKAKTYEGRTVSLKGLHSKTLRGVDWATAAIKSSDITFFSRVPRKEVKELILIHPASVLTHQTPEDVHGEFTDQLARTKRKARKHSVISLALFVPSLVIDTLAAVIWPFGGLAEIDGVWAYASISAYLTARNVSKRLTKEPVSAADLDERRRLQRELHGEDSSSPGDDGVPRPEGERPRTAGRTVHFQEEWDEEDVRTDQEQAQGKKTGLKIRLVPDEAMETMERYFQEILHKRNAMAFPSSGVPPTKTDVLSSIGWWPDRRGRFPGSHQDGDWDDENWQTRQVKEDLDKVMAKSAKQWDKFCKAYAKYPQRAMKEKGHSRTSEILTRLHIKKSTIGEPQQKAEAGVAPPSKKSEILGKLRSVKDKLTGKEKAESKLEADSVVSSTQ
ncbi:hypothetical protein N0V93_008355 [Gnomoniopsis smithogilvyi]|uniref:Uncharacterized protein n=1 Tax=Gnomoniopsis smithogilvyi TaxID=1191159 RepID=A0A9W9CUT4_9PEZI|nr:hypothetical protein N0V93_008355 [Gnomoniopsis smithogilvyi]